jgi:hypothetical protein
LTKKRSRHLVSKATGHQLACAACSRVFAVCRPCFRGHRYCSRRCRMRARATRQKAATKRYATSERGREMARLRQARRRARSRPKPGSVTYRYGHPESQARQGVWGTILAITTAKFAQAQGGSATQASRYRSRPHCTPRFKCCSTCRSPVRWLFRAPPHELKEFYLRHLGVENPWRTRRRQYSFRR